MFKSKANFNGNLEIILRFYFNLIKLISLLILVVIKVIKIIITLTHFVIAFLTLRRWLIDKGERKKNYKNVEEL